MVEIDYQIDSDLKEINEYFNDDMTKFLEKIIEEELDDDLLRYISVTVVDNDRIREINREYRNKDSVTDVISFAYLDNEDVVSNYQVLGDIVISYEKAIEQAKEYNHSVKREIFYLMCHSLLHLLGYDHMNEEDKKIMREKEEHYLNKYQINR